MSLNENSITVYWAIHARETDWAIRRLVQENPVFLNKDDIDMNQKDTRSQVLLSCPAHQDSKSNMLFFKFPIDADFEFDEEKKLIGSPKNAHFLRIGNPDYNAENVPSLTNNQQSQRMSVSFEFQTIFFCEDSLEMEILPPYLHNTVASQYGAQVTGKFDIGQWFRALNVEYLLWNNIKTFKCKDGDPSMYVKFYTDKKIILKEFRPNNFLHSSAIACESLTSHFKNYQTLQWRYNRFNPSLKCAVLQEIKKNLL